MHTLGKWSHKSEVVGQGLFLLVIFFFRMEMEMDNTCKRVFRCDIQNGGVFKSKQRLLSHSRMEYLKVSKEKWYQQ